MISYYQLLISSEGDFHRDVASIRLARRRYAPRGPLTVQHIDLPLRRDLLPSSATNSESATSRRGGATSRGRGGET